MVVRVKYLHELVLPVKTEPVKEVTAPPQRPEPKAMPPKSAFTSSRVVARALSALSPNKGVSNVGASRNPLAQRTSPKLVPTTSGASPAKRVATRSERSAALSRGLPARSPRPLSGGSSGGGSGGQQQHAAGNARQYAMLSRRAQQVCGLIGSQRPAGNSAPQSPLRAPQQQRTASVYRTMTTSGCDVYNNRRLAPAAGLARPRTHHLGMPYLSGAPHRSRHGGMGTMGLVSVR